MLSYEIPAPLEEELRRHWKLLLGAGILALITGTLSILLPLATGIAIATLVGVLMLFYAGSLLADAWASRRSVGRALLRVLLAILYAFAGIWLLAAPLQGTITLTFVLIALFLVEGTMRIVMAIRERELPGRGWQIAGGALTLLLALLIWADFPSSAAWAIGLLVGVNLIFWGWELLGLSLAGRRLARSNRPSSELRPA
jgi:uncharacterized membrane protein HdeD (DUF308 family)